MKRVSIVCVLLVCASVSMAGRGQLARVLLEEVGRPVGLVHLPRQRGR
jgi:hypothetical protein